MHSDTPVAKAPETAEALQLRSSIWITVNGKSFGGAGRTELLTRIAACGSISQAAKAMGMSYKAAWDAIESMETLAGKALVERSTGGKGGGGSRLTSHGEELVSSFRTIQLEHRRFVDNLALEPKPLRLDKPPPDQTRRDQTQQTSSTQAVFSEKHHVETIYIEPLARPSVVDKYLPLNWRDALPLPTHIRNIFQPDGKLERCIGYDVTNQACFTCYTKPLKNEQRPPFTSEEVHAWRVKKDQWLVFRLVSTNESPPLAHYEFNAEIPW